MVIRHVIMNYQWRGSLLVSFSDHFRTGIPSNHCPGKPLCIINSQRGRSPLLVVSPMEALDVLLLIASGGSPLLLLVIADHYHTGIPSVRRPGSPLDIISWRGEAPSIVSPLLYVGVSFQYCPGNPPCFTNVYRSNLKIKSYTV